MHVLHVIHVSSVSRRDHENFGCAQIPNQSSKTAPRFSFVSQRIVTSYNLKRTVTPYNVA